MGEVTALRGCPIPLPDGEPDQKIVSKLEELLEKAKSGRIHALAWATYSAADMTTYGWETGDSGFQLAAAIVILNHDYARMLSESE